MHLVQCSVHTGLENSECAPKDGGFALEIKTQGKDENHSHNSVKPIRIAHRVWKKCAPIICAW